MSCYWFSDPVDKALHAAGCCECLIGASARRKQLDTEEARRLAGLFGFALQQLDNGLWIAVDEARGLQTPDNASLDTAHREDDMAGLVLRARCADRLAGPMTIAEAEAILAPLGFVLSRREHRFFGRQWYATSQDREQSTSEWYHLKDIVTAAKSIILADQYKPARQERMLLLTRQMPIDLGPKPCERTPQAPPERPAPARDLNEPAQLRLDLEMPPARLPPPLEKPKRRRKH
jgi:hypothetical protein